MKRKAYLLALMLIALLPFTSCNKDSDNDDVIPAFSKSDLSGTWEASAVQVDGAWKSVTADASLKMTLTFYESGIYSGEGYLADGYGSYTISGNTVSVLYNGAVLVSYTFKQFTTTGAEVTIARDGTTVKARISKSSASGFITD